MVLHRDDAVSSKVSAMVGCGLPRDFIDVVAALLHYDRATLLRLHFERDPGLRPDDVALAMRQLDLVQDEDFAPYGLDATAVAVCDGLPEVHVMNKVNQAAGAVLTGWLDLIDICPP